MTKTAQKAEAENEMPPEKLHGEMSAEKSWDVGKKQHVESAAHPPRDTKAELRELLELVARAAGIEDDEAREAQIEWVGQHFSAAHMALSRSDRAQIEKEYALSGTPVELQTKLGAASQQRVEDAGRWKRFAQTTLAATLRRMEERGDTPEEEMDALMQALRPARERLRPAAAMLMLAARARMAEQLDQDDGYYKTRGALADQLSRLKDAPSQRRRAFLYWEILCELQARGAERIAGGAWASIVNTDANNLAVVLDDLGETAQSVFWMKLAVMAGSAARRLGADAAVDAQAHLGLKSFLGDAAPTPEWAALLGDMGNVPGAWKTSFAWGNASDLDMWLVEMGAAVARCGVGDVDERPRKVAAALFNAGVTVSRGAKSSGGQWRHAPECRIALNGAGLLWVLSQSQGDRPEKGFLTAMRTHAGGSCAVNLLGALVDLCSTDSTRNMLDQKLASFAAVLNDLKPALPGDDWIRIEGSMKRLNLEPKNGEGDPVSALSALVESCLPAGDWKTAWTAFAGTPKPKTLGALLARTGEAGHVSYLAGMKRLTAALAGFEDVGRRWPDAFVEMAMNAPPGHEAIVKEWQAMRDDSVSFPDRLAAMAKSLVYG